MYTDYRSEKLLEILTPVFNYFGNNHEKRFWDYCGILEKPSFTNKTSTHRFRIHQNFEAVASNILQAVSNELTSVFQATEYFCVQGSDYVSDTGTSPTNMGPYQSAVFTRQIIIDIKFSNYDLGFDNYEDMMEDNHFDIILPNTNHKIDETENMINKFKTMTIN